MDSSKIEALSAKIDRLTDLLERLLSQNQPHNQPQNQPPVLLQPPQLPIQQNLTNGHSDMEESLTEKSNVEALDIKDRKRISVTKPCLVASSIGQGYQDEIWCDVMPMDACHLLLGSLNTIHDGFKNTYTFGKDRKKIKLMQTEPEEVQNKEFYHGGSNFCSRCLNGRENVYCLELPDGVCSADLFPFYPADSRTNPFQPGENDVPQFLDKG